MHQRSPFLRTLTLLPLIGLGACSGLMTLGVRGDGLGQVDDLLSYVERVQVEAVVSKERAQGGLDALRVLLAPEFRGDPVEGHKALVAAVEQSEEQAEALQGSVRPMRKTADSVFARWTADLESFGNISLRTRSQERLEETRKRYDAILATAVSAQLAYNSYNSDLKDNALFLEHDFNATAVQSIAGELDGLRARGKELARRLDACAAACQAYVEFSAPSAQVAPEDAPSDPQDAAPAGPKKPGTKTTTKLPPKSTRTPASGPEGG